MIGPEILVFAIPIIAIVAWAVTKVSSHFFEYLSGSKNPPPEGASLTTSELRALIDEAVNEATAELEARVEALESQLSAPHKRPLLDEADDEPQFIASEEKRPGSRNEVR